MTAKKSLPNLEFKEIMEELAVPRRDPAGRFTTGKHRKPKPDLYLYPEITWIQLDQSTRQHQCFHQAALYTSFPSTRPHSGRFYRQRETTKVWKKYTQRIEKYRLLGIVERLKLAPFRMKEKNRKTQSRGEERDSLSGPSKLERGISYQSYSSKTLLYILNHLRGAILGLVIHHDNFIMFMLLIHYRVNTPIDILLFISGRNYN
jgi:hypothetical protein